MNWLVGVNFSEEEGENMKHTQQEIEKSIPFMRMPMLCLGEPRRNFVYNRQKMACFVTHWNGKLPFPSSPRLPPGSFVYRMSILSGFQVHFFSLTMPFH